MPRKRRKARQRLGFNSGHVLQLLTGNDYFHDAFGDDVRAMKKAWPLLKSQVLELSAKRERAGPPFGCRFDKKVSA